ncbi:DUF6406 domain-containing protein [Streptomyces diastaticus]|uniref:DUF6406 domain-containing protein n=1 Tax=Streptomyces diastaticus TaxID=1956 RepID=UPI0034245B47
MSRDDDAPRVKYPFAFDGRWVLRHHVPYSVEHEGRTHRIVATVFSQPSVHGRVQISCEGLPPVEHDGLTPGDTVEVTGDTWRVAEVDYRTCVVLEGPADTHGEDSGDQADA